jgi:hypothetical protein
MVLSFKVVAHTLTKLVGQKKPPWAATGWVRD